MYTRSMFATADMQARGELLNSVAVLVEQEVLTTTMQEDYGEINAENLQKAHARMGQGTMIGKLVLGRDKT